MKLAEVIEKCNFVDVSGDKDVEVTGIIGDSREVEEGMIYAAVKGTSVDGAIYIQEAIDKGVDVIVSERRPANEIGYEAWIQVKDSATAMAQIASLIEGEPSKEFKLIGVTGTNGKTTSTYMMHHILHTALLRAGLLGTIKLFDGEKELPVTHTTPNSGVLQKQFRQMADNGCRAVAMEVSSHGIQQKRVAYTDFDVVVFSNLTQDHLDYHGDMDSYYMAKRELFVQAAESNKKVKAIINIDDPYGAKLAKEFAEKISVTTYGMGVHCEYRFGQINQSVRGTEFELNMKGKSYLVRIPTIGRFNMYNAVSAIAASMAAGVSAREAVKAIGDMPQVPGRLELVERKMGVSVFVDYAHTPDALANVCATLKELDPKRLITVFGCGGDRDRSKRPRMAEAANDYSDLCFITSDNPRTEDPQQILRNIEVGMKGCPSRTIEDREEAIQTAIAVATGGDIVLIAGKGHEDYQILKDETVPFDDRIKARAALREFKVTNLMKDREEKESNDRDRDRPRFDGDRDRDKPRFDRDGPRPDGNRDRPRPDGNRERPRPDGNRDRPKPEGDKE